MSKLHKTIVIAGLALIVVVIFIIKDDTGIPAPTVDYQPGDTDSASAADDTEPGVVSGFEEAIAGTSNGLPKMLEIGSDTCKPCKMMMPIIDKLTAELDGKLNVEFINVRTNPDAAGPYNVSLIPTQVFLSPEGKELFRHTGFFPMEDILKKWKEFGYDFTESILR